MIDPHNYTHQRRTFTGKDRVTVGGSKFVAIDGKPGKCGDCAFKAGFGCSLWRVTGSTMCQPKYRDDGRDIVWMPIASIQARQPSTSTTV